MESLCRLEAEAECRADPSKEHPVAETDLLSVTSRHLPCLAQRSS
jgi:hypothetical protein